MATPKAVDIEKCQASCAFHGARPLSLGDRSELLFHRIVKAVPRRIERARLAVQRFRNGGGTPPTKTPPRDESALSPPFANPATRRLEAGSLVEVLPFEEIARTLDTEGKCDGLIFMEGMKRHCGKQHTVLRRVRRMFDERHLRMMRMVKSRYLLHGAICDGQGVFDKEGCDRCCFYFWSDRWLRKLP